LCSPPRPKAILKLSTTSVSPIAARKWQTADGADAPLDRLFDAIASLVEFAHRGPVPPELATLGIADWCQLSVPPYRIIYAVDTDTGTVAVVVDGRRDFASLLERRLLQSPSRI